MLRKAGTPNPLRGFAAPFVGVMWRFSLLTTVPLVAFAGLISCAPSEQTSLFVVDNERDRTIEYQVSLPIERDHVPLIIISHGNRGYLDDHRWLVGELVKAGFAVVVLNHPKDNRFDSSSAGTIRVWDRPPDISFLITSILNNDTFGNQIDESRVGAVGYSSGGQTVISLAGGVYDPKMMGDYCESAERGPDCDLAEVVDVDFSDAGGSYRDDRIQAVFAMAPALGPGMTIDGLTRIDIPVGLVATEDDELVLPIHHAKRYSENIPGVETTLLPKGGHFVYVTSCTLIPFIVDFFMSEIDLCGRAIDVERETVQAEVAIIIVDFFNRHLSGVKS